MIPIPLTAGASLVGASVASRVSGGVARICVIAAGLLVSTASFSQVEFKDLSITVKPGDTFSSIISRELQSLDAWGEIARYNKLESPDNLNPGDVIVIPKEVLRLRDYATVVFTKGMSVHLSAEEGTRTAVTKGDRIYTGDLIETDNDGFVSLTFNGGSSVNIQPDSKMQINLLRCTNREVACEVNLRSETGQLGLDVRSTGFEKPTVFSIESPYASAAVRGTRFDFDIDDGNRLGVTEGTVEIALNGNTQSVGIGKGVLAGEGTSINDLIDLLEKPTFMLRDDVTRVSSEDIINWEAVSGAASYIIAISGSESAPGALTNLTEEGLFIQADLPVGESWISARGLAANGLRGFSDKKKLLSVSVAEDIEPPELEIQIAETEMQIVVSGTEADDVEVKIGNAVVTIGADEYILSSSIQHVKGGDTITVQVDPSKQWYIQSRKVVTDSAVSPYGFTYFFDKFDE